MSKEKFIKTIKGESHPISKCRKFETGYYLVGDINIQESGDCYYIDGKYYRFETGQIVFNYLTKQYVLKNDTLQYGIVELKDKNFVYGYFSKTDDNTTVILANKSEHYIISESIFENSKEYREKLSNGKYYHISLIPAVQFQEIRIPSAEYKTSLPYDSSGVIKNYIQKYEELDPKINDAVDQLEPLIKDFSFGLEYETTAGFLPDRILNKTGLIPLRDGSIPGIEYVTVPMTGVKGIQTIVNGLSELEKRTKYDISCALHLHIGNIPREEGFILALFKTFCAIQDDIYKLFPIYKKYNFGVKNKNYSQPFPVFELISQLDKSINKSNLSKNFKVLYDFLSMGEPYEMVNSDLKYVKVHPADRDNRAKWQIKTR